MFTKKYQIDNGKTYFSSRHAKEDFPDIKCHKSILRAAKNNGSVKQHHFTVSR